MSSGPSSDYPESSLGLIRRFKLRLFESIGLLLRSFLSLTNVSLLMTISAEKFTIVPLFSLLWICIFPARALTRHFELLSPIPIPDLLIFPLLGFYVWPRKAMNKLFLTLSTMPAPVSSTDVHNLLDSLMKLTVVKMHPFSLLNLIAFLNKLNRISE